MSDDQEITFEPLNPDAPPELLELINKRYLIGEEWAGFVSLYNKLERGKDIILARLKQNIRTTQSPPDSKRAWTIDDLDDAAKATIEYENFINDLNDAHYQMLRVINIKTSLDSAIDGLRSIMANERELSKNLR